MTIARPLQGKKLLVAAIGVGTLTFAACSVFPGCNLMAPPCSTGGYSCYPEPDLKAPLDSSTDAAPGDGSADAAGHGD